MTLLPRLSLLLAGACFVHAIASAQEGGGAVGFAEVNQVSLRYHLVGSGPRTVVLIHELGLSLESWDDIIGDLSRGHRVLRYDLRGFGLSEKLLGAVTIDDEVEDLRALLDHLEMDEPVTIVGGAVGGAIALRFAAVHQERVEAVMALSPAGDVTPASRVAYLARAARLERVGMRADVEGTIEGSYPLTLRVGQEDRVARFRALQYANDPVSVAATLRMIAVTEWAGTWPLVRCPAWFVAASRYAARPVESVRVMADAVARGHFEAMDTGPFMALQSPELLLPLLRTFLEATARRAAPGAD